MSKYGTIDNAIWRHAVFKSLDDDSKLLFFYLKTCGHQNMIGCFHLPLGYIVADIKWSDKKVRQTLRKLFDKGFVMVDYDLEIMLLPKHLIKHRLQNTNQAKGAETLFNDIPKKFKYYKELAEILLLSEWVSKGFRNRLESVTNYITVSVSITETVSETVTDIPQTVCFDKNKSFNEFWELYPRREGKKKAKDKFDSKCNNEITFTDIMISLKNQIDKKWDNPKFIPHATTWLNGELWNDEIKLYGSDHALEAFINE